MVLINVIKKMSLQLSLSMFILLSGLTDGAYAGSTATLTGTVSPVGSGTVVAKVGTTSYNITAASQAVNRDSSVTFFVTPLSGYAITSVTRKINSGAASTITACNNLAAVCSFTASDVNDDNYTIAAIFKQIVSVSAQYSSIPSGAPNGTFGPLGPFDINTTQTFTVTSPANWIVDTVKLDAVGGTDMTLSCNSDRSSCNFSYGVGTTNHVFYVALLPYDNPASVNAPTAAVTTTTVAVTNNITDPDGVQNVTYYLYSDAAGTTLVSSNSNGSFTGLSDSTNFWIKTTAQTKNKTTDTWVNQQSALVNVTTSGPTYILNLSIAAGSGTVTANGIAVTPPITTAIGKNQSVTYIFIPDSSPEYALSDVKINGVSQGPVSPLTIPNVTSDKTVEVYFKRVWTIAVSAGANGAISPANPAKVVDGGSQTFTMLPATGADVLQVLVDNAPQGPISSYTFSNVTADHSISATFVLSASDMNKYSVIPPFIVSAVKPNLLLMIDNSSSMYDLAYSTASTYCFDKSYSDASSYEGYFDQAAIYNYNPVDNKFESGATLPGSCTFKTSYLCVDMVGTSPNRTVTKLIGSGKFFNWLTASKFDVQKKVLTGGKFNTTYNVLEGESRGCVGRRFIKTLPAVAGLTFGVRGPNSYDPDFVNQSTQGGGTRIEIYDAPYNEAECLAAAAAWTNPSSIGDVQGGQITEKCIGSEKASLKHAAYNKIVHNCFWALTGDHKLANINPLQGNCESIYGTPEYNNDPSKITKENGADAVCSSSLTHPDYGNGGGNTLGYLGRCVTKTVSGASVSWSWDAACSDTEVRDYCGGMSEFDVTDPSNAATIDAGNPITVPSFIMDAGFNALGNVAGTFLVRVALSAQPLGIIQDYSNYISFGAMKFNQDGSGSECNDGTNNTGSSIRCAKSCSVTTAKQCYISSDCPAGESCNLNTKIDGGKIIAYNNFDAVGDHTSGLIKTIDDIQATSWTPWAEAYYNSVGYFANRNDLKLNASDFDTAKNPSEIYCRLNNTLIISDGGSTADQHASVTALAGAYNDGDGQTGVCAGFLGSKNLDDLAWLAKNRNIRTFNKAGGSTESPVKNNEFVTTYTVFTGAADAAAGECNPQTLMSQTAINGGTSPYIADGGAAFRNALDDAFKKIAASSASGTAASILSNSEGSGAALMQAVFYPKKDFDKDAAGKDTSAQWLGELQSFWYFLDPSLNKSSIREDSDSNFKLNLSNDKMLSFQFDTVLKKTRVYRFLDSNGDGVADGPDAVDGTGKQVSYDPDVIKSIWRAGRKLWERDLPSSRRTIFTSLDGSSLVKLSTAVADGELQKNATARTYLRVADESDAVKLIDYINGADQAGFRSRKVSISGCGLASCSREWRLGDIISSTPKLVSPSSLNNYSLAPPNGYSDSSYKSFTTSSAYSSRGMAFVGANDGMLHAFRMGILKELPDRFEKAKLTYPDTNSIASAASDLGKEEWAYAPRHVLPYLTYLADPNYTHVYYVDRSPTIADASIGKPAGCASDYSECAKSGSTWRTVLISGMGIGGAVRNKSDNSCATCIKTPVDDVGYSSYFALDITDPMTPALLWEFAGNSSSPNLGLSTTGPAIVRVAVKTKDTSGNYTSSPDHTKNGKWFAVFASGATGAVNTVEHSLSGISEQNLHIFIVDLATGTLIKDIDTGIENAFAGTLTTGVIDTDRNYPSSNGYYSDDAVYIGYVQKDSSTNSWTKGGVLRLLTRESVDPDSADDAKKWTFSKLIDGIGPVTTSVTKLQDRQNKRLWVYFGTGRYFQRSDDLTSTRQALYGIKEPCYSTVTGPTNDFDAACSTTIDAATLVDQSGDSSSPAVSLGDSATGWKVQLDTSDSTYMSERIITDPIALPNGTVFFTSFKPSTDTCQYGGNSFIWAVKYDSGGTPPAKTMQGQALMQVSTGAFAEIKLATAFSNPGSTRYDGRRLATPITGVPPTAQGLSLFTNPPPAKKFLHIREK